MPFPRSSSNRPVPPRPSSPPRRPVAPRPPVSSSVRRPPNVYPKFHPLMLLITIIAGVVLWLVDTILYSAFVDTMPRPLLIGILFGSFCLILSLVVNGFSNYDENIITNGKGKGGIIAIVLVLSLLVTGVGALFQWIYQLNVVGKTSAPTSYIFVIDDSGSMNGNDPDDLRYAAIPDVLKDMPADFPFMVYNFSNETIISRNMGPSDGNFAEHAPEATRDGGTAIKGALETVIQDYENGVWVGGDAPKVVLLTDGYAGDIHLFSSPKEVLKQYNKAGISVSTVGLGQVDESLMENIATTTGGVFIQVDQASSLSQAMESAAVRSHHFDLLSERSGAASFLRGILRVLFLFILGMMISFSTTVAYGLSDAVTTNMAAALATSALGALLMELGTSLLSLPAKMMWLLLWVLISSTFVMRLTRFMNKGDRVI